MQATLRPTPMPYEPMMIGWATPSSPRYVAPAASLYFVPSLKMLPTSMPLRRISGCPHVGHGSPSCAFVRSATTSGVKSRPTFTLR